MSAKLLEIKVCGLAIKKLLRFCTSSLMKLTMLTSNVLTQENFFGCHYSKCVVLVSVVWVCLWVFWKVSFIRVELNEYQIFLTV